MRLKYIIVMHGQGNKRRELPGHQAYPAVMMSDRATLLDTGKFGRAGRGDGGLRVSTIYAPLVSRTSCYAIGTPISQGCSQNIAA